jgi:hypothetical protein
MLTAMARELVENKGIGESADSVWKSVQQLRPSMPVQAEEGPEGASIEQAEVEISATLPLMIEGIPGAALLEAATVQRHPRKPTAPGQLSLF